MYIISRDEPMQLDVPPEASMYAEDLGEFQHVEPMEESNMQPPELIPRHIEEPDSGAVTYDVIASATSRGKVFYNKMCSYILIFLMYNSIESS